MGGESECDDGSDRKDVLSASLKIKISEQTRHFYFVAEATGFEPAKGVNPYTLSKRAPSTTRTRFRLVDYNTFFWGEGISLRVMVRFGLRVYGALL